MLPSKTPLFRFQLKLSKIFHKIPNWACVYRKRLVKRHQKIIKHSGRSKLIEWSFVDSFLRPESKFKRSISLLNSHIKLWKNYLICVINPSYSYFSKERIYNMYLNKFIFPAPHSTYNANTVKHNLIWITRPKKQLNKIDNKDLDSDQINRRKYSKNSDTTHRRSTYILSEPDLPQEPHVQYDFMRHSNDGSSTRNHFGAQSQREHGVPDFEDHMHPEQNLEGLPSKDRGSDRRSHKKSNRGCFEFFSKQKTRSTSRNKTPKKDMEGSKSARLERGATLGSLSSEKNLKSADMVRIPCLYIPSRIETRKTVLYFHSNGEDLYQTYELLLFMGDYLHVKHF